METKKPKPANEPADPAQDSAKEAIRKAEYARMKEAYRLQPDMPDEADDWSSAEEFRA